MKVIFLDIDGVVYPCFKRKQITCDIQVLRDKVKPIVADVALIPDWDLIHVCYGWDSGAMERLKRLLVKHDARIVIESSWRYSRSLHDLKRLFALWGLREYVMDITSLEAGFLKEPGILAYLKQHEDIEQYVILDDIPMEKTFGSHAVRCPDIFDEDCYYKANRCLYGI